MKRMILAGLLASAFVSPALADRAAVRCVQQQLSDLGENVGTVDGLFGGKTRTAGAARLAKIDNPSDFPPLSKNTAAVWCEKLAGLYPQVANAFERYQGNDGAIATDSPFVTVLAGPGLSSKRERWIVEGINKSVAFFKSELAFEFKRPVYIAVSNDTAWIARQGWRCVLVQIVTATLFLAAKAVRPRNWLA